MYRYRYSSNNYAAYLDQSVKLEKVQTVRYRHIYIYI